jgi:hypothetical protein
MEFVNKDFNTTIRIRRHVVLTARHAVLKQSSFVGQPLRLELCKEQLKPVAVGRSKTAGKRL